MVQEPPVLFLKFPTFHVSGSKYLALMDSDHQKPNYPKENNIQGFWDISKQREQERHAIL